MLVALNEVQNNIKSKAAVDKGVEYNSVSVGGLGERYVKDIGKARISNC